MSESGTGPSERMGKENETKATGREDRNEVSLSSAVYFLPSVATPGRIGM